MDEFKLARLRLPEDEFLKKVADNVPAIAVHMPTGKIVQANAAAHDMFGCDIEEGLIGEPYERFIPSELRPKHHGHAGTYEKNPYKRAMGAANAQLRALKWNGKDSFPAAITLIPIKKSDLYAILIFLPLPKEGE
jgi:PAS domain S-box-containing protein